MGIYSEINFKIETQVRILYFGVVSFWEFHWTTQRSGMLRPENKSTSVTLKKKKSRLKGPGMVIVVETVFEVHHLKAHGLGHLLHKGNHKTRNCPSLGKSRAQIWIFQGKIGVLYLAGWLRGSPSHIFLLSSRLSSCAFYLEDTLPLGRADNLLSTGILP